MYQPCGEIYRVLTSSRIQMFLKATVSHELIHQNAVAAIRTVAYQHQQIWGTKVRQQLHLPMQNPFFTRSETIIREATDK